MKIAFLGFDIAKGKTKYQDQRFIALVAKFQPQKESPFFGELVKEDFVNADAILITKEKLLDLLIQDIDKLENRLQKTQDEKEKTLVKKCLEQLEKEMPICELTFSDEEMTLLRGLAPLSWKPTAVEDPSQDINTLLAKVLHKAQIIFFFTAGKKEVHAWSFKNGANIVECAGIIHSDLARGFIRAEIISFTDLMAVHNMQEAKTKGLVKLVGKDYITQDGDVIEIKFNV